MIKMKKWIALALTAALLLFVTCMPISADGRHIPVRVNGKTMDGVLLEDTTFVPFDTFCYAMGAERVTWNPKTGIVAADCRGITIESKEEVFYIEANGRCFYTKVKCRGIGGMLYVPVRPLAMAFDAEVIWHEDTRSVDIIDHGGVCKSGDAVYPNGAVMWLSRIIYAEANTEPLLGKIAVGNVIMNRVRSTEFPNTIYSVIFDRKFGVQFTPVANGSIYNDANAECRRAAMMVLEGTYVDNEALYFMNAAAASNLWVKNNRKYLFSIGKHSFYR